MDGRRGHRGIAAKDRSLLSSGGQLAHVANNALFVRQNPLPLLRVACITLLPMCKSLLDPVSCAFLLLIRMMMLMLLWMT